MPSDHTEFLPCRRNCSPRGPVLSSWPLAAASHLERLRLDLQLVLRSLLVVSTAALLGRRRSFRHFVLDASRSSEYADPRRHLLVVLISYPSSRRELPATEFYPDPFATSAGFHGHANLLTNGSARDHALASYILPLLQTRGALQRGGLEYFISGPCRRHPPLWHSLLYGDRYDPLGACHSAQPSGLLTHPGPLADPAASGLFFSGAVPFTSGRRRLCGAPTPIRPVSPWLRMGSFAILSASLRGCARIRGLEWIGALVASADNLGEWGPDPDQRNRLLAYSSIATPCTSDRRLALSKIALQSSSLPVSHTFITLGVPHGDLLERRDMRGDVEITPAPQRRRPGRHYAPSSLL